MKVGHADGSVRIAVGTSKSTTSRIGIYSALPAVAISSATLSQANNTQSMLAHCDFIGWATKLRNGGAGKRRATARPSRAHLSRFRPATGRSMDAAIG
jgi:hypothetical protein